MRECMRATNSAKQTVASIKSPRRSSDKRNQYTRHTHSADPTKEMSRTHLLVPSLSPSCSCIQTPRLPVHSPPEKHDLQSQRMSFLSVPEGRLAQSSVTHTLGSALHPQLVWKKHSPVQCFLCEGCAGARGERSLCVCSVISDDVQCVCVRERWRGGGCICA